MSSRGLRTRVARAGAASALVTWLALNGATVLAADHAVQVVGFAFTPGTVTVAVGDTVTWTNGDGVSHTATADDGSFDTGTIASGTKQSVTLSAVGTFGYHCRIHSAMTATIVVQAAATPPATDTIEPPPHAGDWTVGALFVLASLTGLYVAIHRFGRRRPS